MGESAVLFHSYSFGAPLSRNETHQVCSFPFLITKFSGKFNVFWTISNKKIINFMDRL